MEKVIPVFHEHDELFEDDQFRQELLLLKADLKRFCISSLEADLSIPCHTGALDYLNSLHAMHSTANIIQAQRDFFGAHTYQKKNDTSGMFYHTEW
jgi:6-phosphogluconate dehydrogenase